MVRISKFLFIFLLIFIKYEYSTSAPLPPYIYSISNEVHYIGEHVMILEDKSNKLTFEDVTKSNKFKKSTVKVPNLGVTKSTFWIKFSILNKTDNSSLLLEISQPTLDNIALYYPVNNGKYVLINTGTSRPFYERTIHNQNFIFTINIKQGTTCNYFIKISSDDQIMLPISLGTPNSIFELSLLKDLLFGVFLGALLIMFLYNTFIYITTQDKIYIYYVLYILIVILVQTSLQGYAFKYLWPNNSWLAKSSIFIFPALGGIMATMFAKAFLNLRIITPNYNRVLNFAILILIVSISVIFFGKYRLSFILMQTSTGLGSIFLFFTSYKVFKKGYRPAKFFLFSWSFLLIGAVVFVLKDFAILPYNGFTSSSLQVGSIIEAALLSFALADKINIYKKEKEQSQVETLLALQENERIIKEQNVTLERKVEERTTELVTTNNDLNKTLTDLKEAQMQLVEAEKMASLGQLTAGIAHEINNPINFVTSNITPLKRDVDILVEAINSIESVGLSDISIDEKQQQIEDYKEEIDFDYLKIEIDNLLNGIHEGASRTADIVKGLKIFSRLDEDDIKKADINEGVTSTLIIANNLIGNNIQVIRNLGNIPMVECYPGKLNQVFLNIISNAVFAIQEKFGDNKGGILKITTACDNDNLFIKIEDNGTGMNEATKNKVFEPFFTTKNVGIGTGLGMSIVYNTIKKHNGHIDIISAEGVGTEFIIELQLVFKETESV